MRRDTARAALLFVASSLGGCGGDEGPAEPEHVQLNSGAQGDWFVCANDACTELQTTGLRLAADHRLYHLEAAASAGVSAGHFMDGDPYCVTEAFGRYEHDGGVLRLTLHDGGLTVDTDLVLDDGGVTAHSGSMQKVVPNATGRWLDGDCVLP